MGEGNLGVKYVLFYAVFTFTLALALSLTDFSDFLGFSDPAFKQMLAPSNDFTAGLAKFFFLLYIGIDPTSPLAFLTYLFGALSIPIGYILWKALPFT